MDERKRQSTLRATPFPVTISLTENRPQYNSSPAGKDSFPAWRLSPRPFDSELNERNGIRRRTLPYPLLRHSRCLLFLPWNKDSRPERTFPSSGKPTLAMVNGEPLHPGRVRPGASGDPRRDDGQRNPIAAEPFATARPHDQRQAGSPEA